MVFIQSTYHFFGVHVPEEKFTTPHIHRECKWIDGVISNTPGLSRTGLGHVSAGNYDRNMLFLSVVPDSASFTVPLGSFGLVVPEAFSPGWTRLLRQLAEAAGYKDLEQPGWIVVPDCS